MVKTRSSYCERRKKIRQIVDFTISTEDRRKVEEISEECLVLSPTENSVKKEKDFLENIFNF